MDTPDLSVDAERLLGRLRALGEIGRDAAGKRNRLTGSDADKMGRDAVGEWFAAAGLAVAVDRVGNLFGISPGRDPNLAPVMTGSHIDTVIDAGLYDGCLGVIAGLEAIETMRHAGLVPARSVVVGAFTNEEGVRYAPDMLGSLVYAGGLDVAAALATVGTDGSVLGEELARIGYAGDREPGFLTPAAFIELHIEQGPIMEREGVRIGAVENLQGISWQRVAIAGVANHAGTTPMAMRADAGLAAARVVTFLRDRVTRANRPTVATVGCMAFEPNAINVIPARATFTVDLRDPDEAHLIQEEEALAAYLKELAAAERVTIAVERLARSGPVAFDRGIVEMVEQAAARRGFSTRRMTSGAGQDAQMMARLCPTAMIFVPSIGGISHSAREFTQDADVAAGANVLLDVICRLAD